MEWSYGNAPVYTMDELLVRIKGYLPDDAVDSDTKADIRHALRMWQTHLLSPFYYDFTSESSDICDVDLSASAIDNVTDVLVKIEDCGESDDEDKGCWTSLHGWYMQGEHLIIPRKVDTGTTLDYRIQFLAGPPIELFGQDFRWTGNSAPLPSDWSLDMFDMLGISPTYIELDFVPVLTEGAHNHQPAMFPAAGYFVSPSLTSASPIMAYRGYKFRYNSTGIFLYNVTMHETAADIRSSYTLFSPGSETFQLCVAIRDPMMFEVIRLEVLKDYWLRKVNLCANDQDRSFSSQMLVYFQQEQEKTSERMAKRKRSRRNRVRVNLTRYREGAYG